MNDLVQEANEEIRIFERPSVGTSKKLMAKVLELEKQLAEQVAYGEILKESLQLMVGLANNKGWSNKDPLSTEFAINVLKQQPSPLLLAELQADAVREAYICGYERGHNDTVESQYGYVAEAAEEYASDLIKQAKGERYE